MKTTINITVETDLQYIIIEKQFDLPYMPFYGMKLSDGKNGIILSNTTYRNTEIQYDITHGNVIIEIFDSFPTMSDEFLEINMARAIHYDWKILEDKNNLLKKEEK